MVDFDTIPGEAGLQLVVYAPGRPQTRMYCEAPAGAAADRAQNDCYKTTAKRLHYTRRGVVQQRGGGQLQGFIRIDASNSSSCRQAFEHV